MISQNKKIFFILTILPTLWVSSHSLAQQIKDSAKTRDFGYSMQTNDRAGIPYVGYSAEDSDRITAKIKINDKTTEKPTAIYDAPLPHNQLFLTTRPHSNLKKNATAPKMVNAPNTIIRESTELKYEECPDKFKGKTTYNRKKTEFIDPPSPPIFSEWTYVSDNCTPATPPPPPVNECVMVFQPNNRTIDELWHFIAFNLKENVTKTFVSRPQIPTEDDLKKLPAIYKKYPGGYIEKRDYHCIPRTDKNYPYAIRFHRSTVSFDNDTEIIEDFGNQYLSVGNFRDPSSFLGIQSHTFTNLERLAGQCVLPVEKAVGTPEAYSAPVMFGSVTLYENQMVIATKPEKINGKLGTKVSDFTLTGPQTGFFCNAETKKIDVYKCDQFDTRNDSDRGESPIIPPACKEGGAPKIYKNLDIQTNKDVEAAIKLN